MSVFDDELKSIIDGEFSEIIILETPYLNIETRGLYDETYEMYDPETGASILSQNPRVILYANDILERITKIEQFWKVIARSKRFSITNAPKDDGNGLIVLELKNA